MRSNGGICLLYVGNPFSDIPLDRLKIEDAKPIYVFDAATELAFFEAASDWAFPVHFTLAKTGLRIGEIVHLLVEDLDLKNGWLHVRNKSELGWRIKTGGERVVPLIAEVIAVLRSITRNRTAGPVLVRERFGMSSSIACSRRNLAEMCQVEQRRLSQGLSRTEIHRIARRVWWKAGAVKADAIRNSFIRIMKTIGEPTATCPKSWRHTFATLLQDANVDPLVRQITLDHSPASSNGLGMTAKYTHTRPETQKAQIERALCQWPLSLAHARKRTELHGY